MKPANAPSPENPVVLFGRFVRDCRLSLKATARSVANAAGMQPSNLCALEHGMQQPPQNHEKLRRLAAALHLEIGTQEFANFADLAAKANNSTPIDLAQILTENDAMPVLLRTIGNKKLTKADLRRISEFVRAT